MNSAHASQKESSHPRTIAASNERNALLKDEQASFLRDRIKTSNLKVLVTNGEEV